MAPKPRKGPACTVCQHPERHRIEMVRLAGGTADAICEQFGLKRDAIYRHMARHVRPEVKAQIIADVPLSELAERARAESMSLLDYLHLVRSTVLSQMLAAASVNDGHRVAALAKRATEILKEIGRLTGEILNASPAHVTNNTMVFMGSPLIGRLQRMLLDRLAPHPAALAAVLDGLDALEHETPEIPPTGRPVTLEHAHAA